MYIIMTRMDDNEDVNMLFKIFLEYEGYKVDVYTDPIKQMKT